MYIHGDAVTRTDNNRVSTAKYTSSIASSHKPIVELRVYVY